MSVKKGIIVQDTCILLDLVDLELLEGFFQLDIEVFTTPQVIAEITNDQQWEKVTVFVQSKRLKIDGKGVFESIVEISDTNPSLSFADSSVVELASRIEGIVLSSDGSLRKVSMRKGLEVHGMLWIIEQLSGNDILSIEDAIKKLDNYSILNQWSPKKEIIALMQKLKNKK